MPLTKLFHKRHSLNEMSAVKLANEDIEKLRSSSVTSAARKVQVECNTNQVIQDKPCNEINCSSTTEDDGFSSKYEYLEKEVSDNSVNIKHGFEESRRRSAPPGTIKKTEFSKVKSTFYDVQCSKSEAITGRRKKCLSESKTQDLELDELKDAKKLIQLDQDSLEDMIGRCLNRAIKESILTVVKNVSVDGIYEEIIENISSRKLSERYNSEESNYSEQKHEAMIKTLQDNEKKSPSVMKYQSEIRYLVGEKEPKGTVEITKNLKADTHSLDGYSSDFEESVSLHSTDTEIKEKLESEEMKIETDAASANATTINETNDEDDGGKKNEDCNEISDGQTLDNEERTISVEANDSLLTNSKLTITHPSPPKEDVQLSTVVTNEFLKTNDDKKNEGDSQIESKEVLTKVSFETERSCHETVEVDEKNHYFDEESDLMVLSSDAPVSLPKSSLNHRDSRDSVIDSEELFQEQSIKDEEKKSNNWKVGYLHVKLPHKTRSKSNLKAWKKRCVSIQPDEFVNDPKNPYLMISVYSAESSSARKHGASFWKSISSQKAVVYRSSSRTHKYAFSISEDNKVVIHLAADSETKSQEWMAAIRSILWPPSPVMELEKMLNGKEFEISVIDNDFAFRAGLLGMYGYLTVTRKKLILVHSQQGYVIQEWYLNTVDKFELIPQSKIEDANKILAMTTCSDSSTGKGEILMYCSEAVAMLQAIASTIHQILTEHIEQEGGKYEKELAELADWLVSNKNTDDDSTPEDYYKVPPRQVKSLLDIPNFIFKQPLTPSNTVSCSAGETIEQKFLAATKTNQTRASQDSGISAGNTSDDFLNSSITSFVVGGEAFPGKSSDSELSESYTPPRSPVVKLKQDKKITSEQIT